MPKDRKENKYEGTSLCVHLVVVRQMQDGPGLAESPQESAKQSRVESHMGR